MEDCQRDHVETGQDKSISVVCGNHMKLHNSMPFFNFANRGCFDNRSRCCSGFRDRAVLDSKF